MLVIKKQPYLQMPLTDGVTVMWETDAPGSSEVEVWLSRRRHTECIPGDFAGLFSGAPGTVHRVRISGLQPQTGYHYRVRSVRGEDTLESGYFEFCTQCETGTPFSFCVTSETGGYGGFNEVNFNDRLFAAMKEQRPDFLVFAGDMASNGRDWEDWNKYMFHPGAALLSSTPFYLCQGNHEENTPLLPALFSFPEPMNYYSFDYGNAHFTVLDSTTLFQYRELPDGTFDAVETAEFTPESPQMRFLVNDLEQTAADWRFVVFHYPPFVSGFYEVPGLRKLCPLFEEHLVDIVFNSHTIVYERSHPIRQGRIDRARGVTYMVVGGAGTMPGWFLDKKLWHTAKSAARPHFVSVSVAGRSLYMEAVDLNGYLFDQYTITKS